METQFATVPPGRRSGSTKSRRTRALILNAGIRRFQELGFEAATMKVIADGAGVAVGAAYYYFKTKEDIVLGFYEESVHSFIENAPIRINDHQTFSDRFIAAIEYRLEDLAPSRSLLGIVAKVAIDPGSGLSPFGDRSKALRESSISLFRDVLDGSHLSLPKALGASIPRLLWAFHLGILLFWLHDRSTGQVRTRKLLRSSAQFIERLLKISSLPGAKIIMNPVFNFLESLNKLFNEETRHG